MKKHLVKIIALLIFVSAAFTSCSVQYRERHGYHHDQYHDDHH